MGKSVSISDANPVLGVFPSLAGDTIGGMIGLGVGIDYALFVVTRYREGLDAGRSPEDATRMAMHTAGRAVIFAGLTVMISLLGLLLIGLGFMTGLAIGAAVTVGVTMVASVTLLPALLGFVRVTLRSSRLTFGTCKTLLEIVQASIIVSLNRHQQVSKFADFVCEVLCIHR